ncbi:hypothetical protein BCR34DRAFT_566284 [Clohesyomyces aquaticus]|uniref:Secreted protein n=1 Tax=Clohesyomyces aquaticus TaxID=1231657 RepID=A0A1Y1ZKJ4_9PLEO|nr:hypothetical protein BCR34DRAFT_566284 [Clohesyomyces aquaticus]
MGRLPLPFGCHCGAVLVCLCLASTLGRAGENSTTTMLEVSIYLHETEIGYRVSYMELRVMAGRSITRCEFLICRFMSQPPSLLGVVQIYVWRIPRSAHPSWPWYWRWRNGHCHGLVDWTRGFVSECTSWWHTPRNI